MSNNLKRLRINAGVSLRDMRKYTGLSNPVVSYLENEKRPFKQNHIDRLTAFFNVTSDFLLGRNDYGYIVHFENSDDEIVLAEKEYNKLASHITCEIIHSAQAPIQLTIGSKEEKTIYEPLYKIYRELKGDVNSYDLSQTLNRKLNELTKRMTTEDLERTIKFIEEYILN